MSHGTQKSTVRAVGTGTVGFERESQTPLLIADVLHVPGLKKNLISVSSIEDNVEFLAIFLH